MRWLSDTTDGKLKIFKLSKSVLDKLDINCLLLCKYYDYSERQENEKLGKAIQFD